ncbi:MAG: MATE family efflux transporter, partial [Gammaproteobacteria bacterium]|nr:MATE family efflux transporter [Gammaproteobacteria bacterium]
FLQMLTTFIGFLMVAHLGHDELAASALINASSATLFCFFVPILFAMSVMAGQHYGASRFSEMGELLRQGCVLAIVLTVPMLLLYVHVGQILLLLGQKPALVYYVSQYFHAMAWAVPAILLMCVLQQFLYGILKQRLVITLNVIALVLYVPLAYIFIFGKYGLPALGVAGMGYAYAIEAWFNLFILLICFYRIKDFRCMKIFEFNWPKQWNYFRQAFQIGWPMCFQIGGELLGFFVLSVMIGWIGEQALAADQVVQQWLFLFIVPAFAVSEASGILVSQVVGTKEYLRLPRVGNLSILLALAMAIISSVIWIFFPMQLAGLYFHTHASQNSLTLYYVIWLFRIAACVFLFDSIRMLVTGSLRGLYDTKWPMWASVLSVWVLVIPFAYIFGFIFHWGVIGVRSAAIIGIAAGLLLVLWRWRLKMRCLLSSIKPA